jgi:hypothetical protein
MSSREAQAIGPKKRRAPFSETHDHDTDARQPRAHFSDVHDQQVLTFREWCALNNISPKTGRRILKAPGAPVITMLTKKLIGITIKSDRDWKASRTRKEA